MTQEELDAIMIELGVSRSPPTPPSLETFGVTPNQQIQLTKNPKPFANGQKEYKKP